MPYSVVFLFIFIQNFAFGQLFRVLSTPSPLPKQVNAPQAELAFAFSGDGQKLYMARAHHPGNIGGRSDDGDIWHAQRLPSGQWNAAQNADIPLNGASKNNLIGYAYEINTLYLSGQEKEGPNLKNIILSSTQNHNGTWEKPQKVNIPYFRNKSEHQSGWVNPKGNIMLIAAESFGSYGAEDIFVSTKNKNNEWSILKNLGDNINSNRQDITPYYIEKYQILVFASNGYQSQGSWDLYASKRIGQGWQQWSRPEPIHGLNSAGSDCAFYWNEKENKAYFIRNQNNQGYGNIYEAKVALNTENIEQTHKQNVKLSFTFTIVVNETKQIVKDAKIRVKALNHNWDTLIQHIQNPVPLPVFKGYTFTPQSKGYIGKILTKTNIQGHKHTETLYLERLKTGKTLEFDDVFFQKGTAQLMPLAEEGLRRVLDVLRDNPNVNIFLSGHTDNQGDPNLNLKLSDARVKAIMGYFIAEGITPERLTGKGYGGTKPKASNLNEDSRKLNRRVEFTIVK